MSNKIWHAAEFESLFISLRPFTPGDQLENLKHFLRSSTHRFAQNIYADPDRTFRTLYKLSHNQDVVVLHGDKDSTVLVMPKTAYVNKMQTMIDEGIAQGKYMPINIDTTLQDLKSFQDFLYRHFRNKNDTNLDYKKIRPTSKKPASLYGTAKPHKFNDLDQVTIENLKLRPIVSTCGTYYYETAKALAKYLSPLTENQYNSIDFADRLDQHAIEEDETLVSYDVESLFTSIPLDETIDHILDLIYKEGKLPVITTRLVMKRLLFRVTKGCVFTFNGNLYQQADGCGMGNPLSPVLANIFMCKLELDVIVRTNPPLYYRYVDDCLSKRKTDSTDHLLQSLNC